MSVVSRLAIWFTLSDAIWTVVRDWNWVSVSAFRLLVDREDICNALSAWTCVVSKTLNCPALSWFSCDACNAAIWEVVSDCRSVEESPTNCALVNAAIWLALKAVIDGLGKMTTFYGCGTLVRVRKGQNLITNIRTIGARLKSHLWWEISPRLDSMVILELGNFMARCNKRNSHLLGANMKLRSKNRKYGQHVHT